MAIKVFRSTDAGAPSMTGTAGQLITVLDAVLVNGYNTVSVSSITRSGSTATVTTSGAHGFSTNDWATISGATQTDYNGEFKVTVINSTSFTYTVANSPATPATGTISVKRAPAGFTKSFSGTNKAVYRSNDVTGNRYYLRVLDDASSGGGPKEAQCRGYETMSDVDTGTGPFPTVAQSSVGYYFYKSGTADGTARAWICITDGKIFYFFVNTDSGAISTPTGTYHSSFAFGDPIPYRAGDVYASMIAGVVNTNSPTYPANALHNPNTTFTPATTFSSGPIAMARDFTAIAGARLAGIYGAGASLTGTTCIGSGAAINFPHQVDNGFYMVPVVICQGTPSVIRGRLPGVYESLHGRALSNWDTFNNVQGLTGRTFIMIYATYSSSQGHLIFDLTGNNDQWDS